MEYDVLMKRVNERNHIIQDYKNEILELISKGLNELTGLNFYALGETDIDLVFADEEENLFVNFNRDSYYFNYCYTCHNDFMPTKQKIEEYFDKRKKNF